MRVALVGNPNAGKTTLFNALTGLRAKTANFPGTTIESRVGRVRVNGSDVELLDLPGLYSLRSNTDEERFARAAIEGDLPSGDKVDALLLLLDATNLERNLYLASQTIELGLPVVVALNMTDLAERAGIDIDPDALSRELGSPVVPIAARSGRGIEQLRAALAQVAGAAPPELPPALCNCSGCPFQARYDWAEDVGAACTRSRTATRSDRTDRIDRVLTHPVVGLAAFGTVMFALFAVIFWLAQYPMDWIDRGFAFAGGALAGVLPDGDLRSLLLDGVLGGVGGVLVFLPQICILFFFLALLEDTGYLARGAFVVDRLMRRVGLPGKAFLPMVSAHACAVPAIMATRVIGERRERLLTILVLPLLSCSARIPVYAMLSALLFPTRPLMAAFTFTGAYLLGVIALLVSAFVLRKTLLPGETRPLVIELPGFKLPGLRSALILTFDRAWIFLRNAGTVILVASIVLWGLATYPKSDAPPEATELRAQGLNTEADALIDQHSLSHSFAGRLGRLIEPTIRPLGFDWQIGIGLITSLAAREVVVSTLTIVYGVGKRTADDRPVSLYEKLRSARRTDGRAVFSTATSVSLLVFYVLAMQCFSTLAVTRRETGGWRWPALQFGYMTTLAWVGAFASFQLLSAFGF